MQRVSCRGSVRRALTLIEVIASIALLSTLLVGILAAHQKHVRLIRRDELRAAALKVADNVIEQWMEDGVLVPRHSDGVAAGAEGYRWETRVHDQRHVRSLGVEVVRMSLFYDDDADPIITIDLAVPGRNL